MIEPRKMYLCGQWDNFPTKLGRKADAVPEAEGSSAGSASIIMGAGLRPNSKGLEEPPDPAVGRAFRTPPWSTGTGHAFQRVTRELARAGCLQTWQRKTGREGLPVDQEPWRWQAVPVSQRASKGETRKQRDTTGIGRASDKRSRRKGQPEVVAENSTDGWRDDLQTRLTILERAGSVGLSSLLESDRDRYRIPGEESATS